MADRSFGHLTRQAYAPLPRRSRSAAFGKRVLACAACLALGGAAAIGYMQHQQQQHLACAPCATTPSDDSIRLELTRARLALEQEAAARAAVQQTADAAAAESRRLSEELRFLRSQLQQPPRR
jgi:hypothetical protein